MPAWIAVLDGVILNGGSAPLPSALSAADVAGYLSAPPDGLGLPDLRTEDVTYPQRDGAEHYKDWYEPRLITFDEVTVKPDAHCADAAEAAAALTEAWSRRCDDAELVIFTDRHDPTADTARRRYTGPFGCIGRPRVATLTWLGQGTRVAQATLRFDSVDHRLYILDAAGTPGSGQECAALARATTYEALVLREADRYWRLSDVGAVAVDAKGVADGSFKNPRAELQSLDPMALGLSRSVQAANTGAGSVFTGYNGAQLPFPAEPTVAGSVIEFWATIHAEGSGTYLISSGDTLTAAGPFNLAITASTATTATLTLNWSGVALALGAVARNTVHHFVFRHKGSNMSAFIDGALVATSATMSTLWTAGNWWVGANAGAVAAAGIAMGGRFSDFAVYGDFVTQVGAPLQAWVSAHYAAGTLSGAQPLAVSGNACVPIQITFSGLLTSPRVQVIGGSWVGLDYALAAGDSVTIDTTTGLASGTVGGAPADLTRYVVGDPFLTVDAGTPEVLGQTENPADTGTIQACWRPAVISA